MDEQKGQLRPAVPKAGKRRYEVMVRHSTFLLKRATVEAASPDEARSLFLALAKAKHEDKAARQQGPEKEKAAERVRDAYTRGVAAADELSWVIRPAEEAEAERAEINRQRDERWSVGKAKGPAVLT